MILANEVKYAYRHVPSTKWILLDSNISCVRDVVAYPVNEFFPDILYKYKDTIEEDLSNAVWGQCNNGLLFEGKCKVEEFELVEISCNYKVISGNLSLLR